MRAKRNQNMKGKLILMSILVLLFILFIALRLFIFDKKEDFGELKIASSPSTNIFIDNVNVGKTPYHDKASIGEYLVKLIPDQEASGAAQWQGKIRVYKNSLSYINRELGTSDVDSAGEILTITDITDGAKDDAFGQIVIDSDPVGAIAYLDNEEKGVTTAKLDNVSRGEHELSLFMPGFFRRTQKVNVEGGKRLSALFKLAIDRGQQIKIASLSAGPKKESTESATLTPSPSPTGTGTPSSAQSQVKIKDTPTGYLRVRSEPSVNASEEARVNPGETYQLIGEQPNWYKIVYQAGQEGWISQEYATKITQ
jgi:hypothetical protein